MGSKSLTRLKFAELFIYTMYVCIVLFVIVTEGMHCVVVKAYTALSCNIRRKSTTFGVFSHCIGEGIRRCMDRW